MNDVSEIVHLEMSIVMFHQIDENLMSDDLILTLID
jgi:hypothetical protein